MARIELARQVFDDVHRFFDHMAEFGAASDAPQRINEIIDAVEVLAHSPLIGRKVKGGNRELVIGRSSRGYAALYRYLPDIDTGLSWPSEASARAASIAVDSRGQLWGQVDFL